MLMNINDSNEGIASLEMDTDDGTPSKLRCKQIEILYI